MSLFPLALTPFETYMVVDDRPRYRMTFVMRLDFQGELDLPALRATLPSAIDRHPLLTAKLERRQWQANHVPQVDLVDLPEDTALDPTAGAPIDLAAGRGVRFWVQRLDGGIQLLGEFHHAVSDGIGALQFFGDWLAAYHAQVTQTALHFPPLRPELLRTRGNSRWKTPPHPVTFWQATRAMLSEVTKWMTRVPAPIAAARTNRVGPGFAGCLVHTFSSDDSRALRNVARDGGVTLNDLLLRDLFVVIERWNREHGMRGNPWLQINMPTSLRQRDDDEMPAADVIGYTFLARRAADCQDQAALLAGLAAETKAIRTWGLGMFFLDGLKHALRVPGALRWFSRPGRCMATAVFSNLGDPQRRINARLPRTEGRLTAGNLVLQRVLGTPPLRSETRGSFLASICGEELSLSATLDANYFSREQAQAFLDRWRQQLTVSMRPAQQVESVR